MNVRVLLALLLALGLGTACNGPSFESGAPPAEETPPPSTPPDGTPPEEMPPEETPMEGVDLDGDGYPDLPSAEGELTPEWAARLWERELDYPAALRTASLRLRGQLPTLLEIRYLEGAPDPAVAYAQLLDDMMSEPAFHARMIDLFRDTFRMGGGELDSAPRFAAQLVVEGRDFMEVLTAESGTCPTYDGDTDTFVAGDCDNGVPRHAGLLTHPGVMSHFYSNLAFRRVRWVQEVFACNPFPAEVDEPRDVGGAAPYTAPWPFESIAGDDTGGRIDFHDTSSVVCANCHATMNHLAPLFATFDEEGTWQSDIQVRLPLDESPLAVMGDWLPEGEGTGWRFGVPAEDLPALGRAMAADPAVRRCMVSRMWNFAMGHGDVISQADVVPEATVASYVAIFDERDGNMRAVLRAIFTSNDFVRF